MNEPILNEPMAHSAQAQRPGEPQTTQGAHIPDAQSSGSSSPLDAHEPDPLKDRLDAERLRAQNDDRHKRLVADADKLLALANELKAEVDKTNKNELSVTVVKKAAEMERLARDLKDRMRD